jgi:hypothetical protein
MKQLVDSAAGAATRAVEPRQGMEGTARVELGGGGIEGKEHRGSGRCEAQAPRADQPRRNRRFW